MKTFDKKDVISWANCDEAKKYIGDEGYFCDTYHENLAAWHKGLLQDVDQSMTVECIFEDEENEVFGLFLPADKVKEVEEPKKYRPFRTTEEFSNVTGKRIGSILKFKYVDKDVRYYTRMYTGFHFLENGNIYIELGSEAYSLEQLYNYYEWLDEHGEWQPFGVEEKSKV